MKAPRPSDAQVGTAELANNCKSGCGENGCQVLSLLHTGYSATCGHLLSIHLARGYRWRASGRVRDPSCLLLAILGIRPSKADLRDILDDGRLQSLGVLDVDGLHVRV